MDDKIQHAQLDLCFMKLTATPNWLGRKSRFALSLIVAFCVAIGSGTNRINAQPPQESTLHPPTAKSPPVVPGTTKLNSDQTHSILNPPSITQTDGSTRVQESEAKFDPNVQDPFANPIQKSKPIARQAVAELKTGDKIGPLNNQLGQGQSIQFDKDAAFEYLKEICDIGPRPSASPGMKKQRAYIKKHFEGLGGKFIWQSFKAKSPYHGRQVDLENLMVRWHVDRTKRLLICCHHDTRPFADADKRDPRGVFIGANDGASGVALLCELGKHIKDMEGDYGVDFCFFDGEEFVIVRQRDPMFLGSTYFAHSYANGKIKWRYESAILVDMVADKDLQLFMEGNSLHFAKPLTQEIWATADRIGVKEFLPQKKERFIRDDHLPLNEIAKIPTCDIIDFDYPNPKAGNMFWHTQQDKVANCSAESLGKVGSVVLAWIREKQKPGN